MERNESTKRNPYAGFVFFAMGITCFILAGLLIYLFSGRFVNTPSGMSAGPALSLSRQPLAQDTNPPASVPTSVIRKETPIEVKPWVLYITGEVSAPGVYHLPSESRVFQLVEAAGGLTAKADPVQINMASPLGDGVHVHVPAFLPPASITEIPHTGGVPPSPPPPSSSVNFLHASPASPSSVIRSASPPSSGGLINVNTASAAELERLPGVGPVIARSILECRESQGRFASVEDLLKVKGIGAKKLEAMRSIVAVQ